MKKKPNIIETLERDAAIRITANDYDEVPSEEIRKIHTLIQQSTRKKPVIISYRSYIIGRIAITLTFILIIGCISVYAFPVMLDARLDHTISQKGNIIAFNTPNGNLIIPQTELLMPTYIPDGYTTKTFSLEVPFSVIFQNDNNQIISLVQSTNKTSGILNNVGNTTSVTVHGEAAEFVEREEGGSRLLWMYSGFYFTLESSALSKDEMIKMAESIIKEDLQIKVKP